MPMIMHDSRQIQTSQLPFLGPRICELVRYYLEGVTLKGAWSGPAAIELFEHSMCDVARLPVRGVVSASHFLTDLTLGLGEVVYDYLKDR